MDITPSNPAIAAAYITLSLTVILGLLSAAGFAVCLWNVGIMLTKLVVLTLGGTVGDSLFFALVYAFLAAVISLITAGVAVGICEVSHELWEALSQLKKEKHIE